MSEIDAVGATGGLGKPLAAPIVALPPIEKLRPSLELDPATDEPRRSPLVRVAFAVLLLAAAAAAVGLALAWWRAIHMATFPTAIRLIVWTQPEPGYPLSLIVATAMVVIGVVLVAAPTLAGYLAWVGRPAARWWVLGALALTPATLVITPQSWDVAWANVGWLAVPIIIVGAVLLWLPATRARLDDWQAFRQPATPVAADGPVRYGRLEQFR